MSYVMSATCLTCLTCLVARHIFWDRQHFGRRHYQRRQRAAKIQQIDELRAVIYRVALARAAASNSNSAVEEVHDTYINELSNQMPSWKGVKLSVAWNVLRVKLFVATLCIYFFLLKLRISTYFFIRSTRLIKLQAKIALCQKIQYFYCTKKFWCWK